MGSFRTCPGFLALAEGASPEAEHGTGDHQHGLGHERSDDGPREDRGDPHEVVEERPEGDRERDEHGHHDGTGRRHLQDLGGEPSDLARRSSHEVEHERLDVVDLVGLGGLGGHVGVDRSGDRVLRRRVLGEELRHVGDLLVGHRSAADHVGAEHGLEGFGAGLQGDVTHGAGILSIVRPILLKNRAIAPRSLKGSKMILPMVWMIVQVSRPA